jgi:hypothetical protein
MTTPHSRRRETAGVSDAFHPQFKSLQIGNRRRIPAN